MSRYSTDRTVQRLIEAAKTLRMELHHYRDGVDAGTLFPLKLVEADIDLGIILGEAEGDHNFYPTGSKLIAELDRQKKELDQFRGRLRLFYKFMKDMRSTAKDEKIIKLIDVVLKSFDISFPEEMWKDG